ncbi:hypothetical protein ACFVOR_14770 [Streptomyces sp. NPDC057837]|uniref:hypothetical protein n=1 Tax=Streptomyces sp. NPDC057837 TaxID=3346260 RepID=UPI0036BEB917
MTAEQLLLDCEPNWDDEHPDDEPEDPRLRDLRGQGLTVLQLHNITDVPVSRRYL